jgi:hypothetical protein
MWIKPEGSVNSEGLLCNGNSALALNYSIFRNPTGTIGSYVKQGASTSVVNSTEITPANQWSHIVARFDAGVSQDIIINGTNIKTGTPTQVPGSVAYPIWIGAFGGASLSFEYNGLISDVQLFSGTCLTNSQVERLYNGLNLSPTFHWKFNGADKDDYIKDYGNFEKHCYYDFYYSGVTWSDREVRCWNTRFDEGNFDVTIETFVDACDRNFIFGNVTPAAVTELCNILGTPYYIDSTYSNGNTLIFEPISGYGLSSLVQQRKIGVKSISDTFISPNYFGIKIEGYVINEL